MPWRTELWKDLFALQAFALTIGEQEKKTRDAYYYYKMGTSHEPAWNYTKFRDAVNGTFGITYPPADVHKYMKEILGIDIDGLPEEEWRF